VEIGRLFDRTRAGGQPTGVQAAGQDQAADVPCQVGGGADSDADCQDDPVACTRHRIYLWNGVDMALDYAATAP
jgi:hypothetical protein